MKKEFEDRTTKNGSVHDDNEMFFKELATAYVNKEGEELKGEALRTVHFPTDNLDRKTKSAMKGGSKGNQVNKRRNIGVALSAMAAVLMMFLIYSAIIPTMDRQEQPAGAPEAVMTVEDAADGVSYFEEPEEEPMMEEEEMAVADAEHGDLDGGLMVGEAELEAEPGEVARFFASTIVVEHLEASLPDGYRITHQEVHEDRIQLHLYSATNLPILLIEEPRERFGMTLHGDAEIVEVNGVEVLQNSLSEDEVWLHFQAMESSFTLVGSEPEELMLVTRAILDFPELSGYEPGDDGGVDGADEIILIPLPRGLFMIVPLP